MESKDSVRFNGDESQPRRSVDSLPHVLRGPHIVELLQLFDLRSCGEGDPVYYQNESWIVFPPLTDNPSDNNPLPGIQKAIKAAKGFDPNVFANKKFILFPVFEAQNYVKAPRSHWVVVMHDLATKDTVVIDAATWFRGSIYGLKPMEQALMIGLNVDLSLEKKYLDMMPSDDSDSSGYWACYVIRELVGGINLSVLHRKMQGEKLILTTIQKDLNLLYQTRIIPSGISPRACDILDHVSIQASATFEQQNYGVDDHDETAAINMTFTSQPVNEISDDDVTVVRQSSCCASFKLFCYAGLIAAGLGLAVVALLCLTGHIVVAIPILAAKVTLGLGLTSALLGSYGFYQNRVEEAQPVFGDESSYIP